MITIVVQIGNSDNKLSQQSWAEFCTSISLVLQGRVKETHFSGGSTFDAPWQNACWVAVVEKEKLSDIKHRLRISREGYCQDSIALTVGETEFI